MFQRRLLLVALLLLLAPPAPAQAPAPPTLAEALARAAPPNAGIAVSVGADKVTLPEGSAPPDAVADVADVADAYGRVTRDFGGVSAVAPPAMVVVGVPPDQSNPFAGMPPADVLKLLAGGLDRDQWRLLLGSSGLGLPDLTTPAQRDLFAALFPDGTLKVQWDRPGEANRPEDIRDVSADLPTARLRLAQIVSIGLPEAGHPETHTFGMDFAPAGSPKRFIQVTSQGNEEDFVDGARVRTVLPNAPKDGQLDLDAPALKVPVPLTGLRTVGDLFARVGRLARLELYADARLEGRRFSVAAPAGGKAPAAPAASLLRAAALCLCGAYRKVGPAFVLTDDVAGIGARRQKWADFEREAAAGRAKALDAAGDAVCAGHSALDIPAQGNLMGLSAAQADAARKQAARDQASGGAVPSGMLRLSLPFKGLTPGQQEVARRSAEFYARGPEDERPTLEGEMALQSETSLQLLLPSVDGPVTMEYNFDSLFSPSRATIIRLSDRAALASPQRAAFEDQAKKAAALPLAPLLRGGSRRVVLAHPAGAAGVDSLVSSMKTLGLNQLWLPVFSGGAAQTDTLEKALPEALRVTRGTGIQVFAVLDLLTWEKGEAAKAGAKAGEKAGEKLEDLTLRGETSAEAAARAARLDRLAYGGEAGPPPPGPVPLAVSPFSPAVGAALRAALADLAARSGVAGVVLRDTALAGYLPRSPYREGAAALGYTEPARLAFLRARHADPVDLFPGDQRQERANTRLPDFDVPAVEKTLSARWEEFRVGGCLAFLRSLAAQVPGRVLLAARGIDDEPGETGRGWYGTWDDPARPPTFREDAQQGERAQARAQSRVTLRPVRAWLLGLDSGPEQRARLLGAFKQELQGGARSAPAMAPALDWDGYVLDTLTPPVYPKRSGPPPDPLASLVADLRKP